jgi:hypothetical protein
MLARMLCFASAQHDQPMKKPKANTPLLTTTGGPRGPLLMQDYQLLTQDITKYSKAVSN